MRYFARLLYYRKSRKLLDKTIALAKKHDIPEDEAFLLIDPLERKGKTFMIAYYEAAAYHIDLSMVLTVSGVLLMLSFLASFFVN